MDTLSASRDNDVLLFNDKKCKNISTVCTCIFRIFSRGVYFSFFSRGESIDRHKFSTERVIQLSRFVDGIPSDLARRQSAHHMGMRPFATRTAFQRMHSAFPRARRLRFGVFGSTEACISSSRLLSVAFIAETRHRNYHSLEEADKPLSLSCQSSSGTVKMALVVVWLSL